MQYVSTPQKVVPSMAAPLSVMTSATAWANSAWVEVLASTPTAIVLTGLDPVDIGANGSFEVDIGVGAIGAEVVVTTFRAHAVDSTYHGHVQLLSPIPLDNIPTGVRLALRMRKNTATAVAYTFVLTYWSKPLTGLMLLTAKPQKIFPSAANAITLSVNGTPWASSTYVTVIASTATAMILVGAVSPNIANGVIHEIDVAVGAAGAEVVVTTFRINCDSIADAYYVPFWNPLDAIPAGVRVAARTRRSTTSGTPTIALVYIEKPV